MRIVKGVLIFIAAQVVGLFLLLVVQPIVFADSSISPMTQYFMLVGIAILFFAFMIYLIERFKKKNQ